MGFDHTKTTHHFLLRSDGGSIEVAANSPQDTESRDQIRMHLGHIAKMFAAGNFKAPMLIHDQVPPGVPVMEKLKSDSISADQPKETTRDSRSIAPAPSLRDEKDDLVTDKNFQAERKKSSPRNEYSARTGTGIGGGLGPSAAAAQAQANNALQRGDQAVIAGAAPMREESAPPPPDLDKAELHKAQPAQKAKLAASGVVGLPAAPPPPRPEQYRASGRLRGTVTDPSGAAIAGADVVLKSADGSTVASTATNSSGIYSFNGVAEGNYQLELQRVGFKTDVFTGLNVAAGENVMNAKLELGTATETVEVVAPALVVSSQETEVVDGAGRFARRCQVRATRKPAQAARQ